jgi:hypothetical protein
MSDRVPLRIAIRFPPFVSAQWRERCFASLAAAAHVELADDGAADPVDLVLDLSIQPPDPSQLTLPRKLGYWTFVYGARPERIEPGLQEFIEGGRAAYARLVQLHQPECGVVLREGTIKTVGHSLKATRERLLQAIVDWPGRVLQERLAQTQSVTPSEVRFRRPNAAHRLLLQALRPVALLRNILKRLLQQMTREHWTVGVITSPIQQVCQSFDPSAIQWLTPPADGFIADPFGLPLADGRLAILAEALSWQDGRGRIVTFEWKPDAARSPLRDVFSFSSHASYPHLIPHDSAIYCIPETIAQRRVQLFKADPFPQRWVPDTVLLEDFPGADATVFFHSDRWWLFCGNHDDQDEAKLFIFYSKGLRGPWLPHALNPVKCDLRSSRPAGSLFTIADELYRPAQDCSVTYGGAVVINRIERLTATEFAERPINKLTPAPGGAYPDGLHTVSSAGNLTLVDGKRHKLSAAAAILTLRALVKRLGRRLGKSVGSTARERV